MDAVLRGVALVVLTGAWLAFSFALLVVLALVLLIQGASVAALLAFLLVWLVPTLLLSRLWHRACPSPRVERLTMPLGNRSSPLGTRRLARTGAHRSNGRACTASPSGGWRRRHRLRASESA